MPPALQPWEFSKIAPGSLFSILKVSHRIIANFNLPPSSFKNHDVYLVKMSASRNPLHIHSARCTKTFGALRNSGVPETELLSARRVRAESGATAVFTVVVITSN